MKKKDVDELKNKSLTQIRKALSDLEKEIINTKMDNSNNKVKNVHAFGNKKRDVARARTFLNEKLALESQNKEAKNVTK